MEVSKIAIYLNTDQPTLRIMQKMTDTSLQAKYIGHHQEVKTLISEKSRVHCTALIRKALLTAGYESVIKRVAEVFDRTFLTLASNRSDRAVS